MIRFVLADNPSPMTLDGTRTYLIGSSEPVVVDPGPDVAGHLRRILAALDGATPTAILLTHGHPDHAAAAPALAQATGAPVCMSAGGLELPFAPALVSRWLRDGDRIHTDAGAVSVVATPGHAPEHLCFAWKAQGAGGPQLLVGDLFMGHGDTTLVAPPEGDLHAYLRSLDRVERLAPEVMYPSHGPALRDPLATIRSYREHREQRIRQVEDALRRRPGAAIGELVDEIYGPDLQPPLRGAAAGSIQAILDFLGRPSRRID